MHRSNGTSSSQRSTLRDAPAGRRGHGSKLRTGLLTTALLGMVALLGLSAVAARASEVIPPAPPNHFNDYAGVVPAATAEQLDRELTQFERDTSNQIVVAIYPKMQSDSSIDDYSVRLYQAWHIGQKGRDNGALLLIFTQDHRMRIATGYGLEGALPDAICRRILDNEIAPRLRAGDVAGGLTVGVHAMMAAAKGEYRGTGQTAREAQQNGNGAGMLPFAIFIVLIIFSSIASRFRRTSVYGRAGRSTMWWGGPWGGGGWGGGGWSGGGGGGGWSAGSFSGGGGSTGGGGASGSW